MLVLSRAVGQRIVIAESITIEVVGMFGGKVQLGIEAPKNVTVHREEVSRDRKASQQPPRQQEGDQE